MGQRVPSGRWPFSGHRTLRIAAATIGELHCLHPMEEGRGKWRHGVTSLTFPTLTNQFKL
jgi:hypothetical protein